jgi:hypothetical protein
LADLILLESTTVVIAQGASLSAAAFLAPKVLCGIVIPATWVTAGLTFQASGDGGITFGELLDETATAKSVSSVAGGAYTEIAVDPTKWRGISCIKVRSGTAASPVAQSAVGGVTLTLLRRLVT